MGFKVTHPLVAQSPAEYIAAIEDPGRRADIETVDAMIRLHAPKLEPAIMHGMLGYGPFAYRYASGREGKTAKLCVANQKNYISLYCCGSDDEGYVAERFRETLPKADIGKGCVRFKRLADLDRKALTALIKMTAQAGWGL